MKHAVLRHEAQELRYAGYFQMPPFWHCQCRWVPQKCLAATLDACANWLRAFKASRMSKKSTANSFRNKNRANRTKALATLKTFSGRICGLEQDKEWHWRIVDNGFCKVTNYAGTSKPGCDGGLV